MQRDDTKVYWFSNNLTVCRGVFILNTKEWPVSLYAKRPNNTEGQIN